MTFSYIHKNIRSTYREEKWLQALPLDSSIRLARKKQVSEYLRKKIVVCCFRMKVLRFSFGGNERYSDIKVGSIQKCRLKSIFRLNLL